VEVVKPFHARRNFTQQGTSATLEPVKVTAAKLFGLSVYLQFISEEIKIKTPFHLVKSLAGLRHQISVYTFTTSVFLLNSRHHVFSATHFCPE